MRDPDATVVRPPRPGPDPDATVVRAPRAGADPDATVVRPARAADPDATVVRPARAADPDATVVRPVWRAGGDATAWRERGQPAGGPLPREPLALPAGTRLHEYRIEGVLGQGGFGITYLATDVNLHAQVAIKEYLPAEIAFRAGDRSVSPNASRHRERYRQGLESFLAEARTLATFRHPNIVRVARFFEAHRTAYMVLEYERGEALRHWWPAQHLRLGEAGLVERLQPLLDGLSVVHAAGFLHRDIKPDNIQVRASDGRFVLLDFGSAAQAVALAEQDVVVVTPGFAPIEQYGQGQQGAWTDIYALGATLYWAVCGRKPPDADARADGEPMVPAVQAGAGRYGRAFLEAIDRALAPDPAARPRRIEDWREALLADHLSTLSLKEVLGRGEARPADEAAGRRPLAARLRGALSMLVSPGAWPLALKLTLALLATALLPMVLTASWNLHGSREALTASQLRKAELIAHNTAGRLGQLLDDSRKLARGLGTDDDFQHWLERPDDADRAALRRKVQALAAANPDIHLVMLLDREGTARVSNDPATMDRNYAFRQYFQEAIAGRPFTTGIVVGSVAGAAGVFFSEPVRDAQGQPIGAVVLRIRASAIGAILDEVRHDSELTPFLVDGDGVLVSHPRQDLLYRSLVPLPADAMAAIKADQRFRRDRVESLDEPDLARAMVGAAKAGHVAYRSTVSGVEEIAGFAPVPHQPWVVGVSETRASFEAPIVRLADQLVWSVVLAGALFAALAMRFARSLVRPIRALTDAAHALKSGDFAAAHVDVQRRDELGHLARTFNVMIDVLRQREREREREVDSRRL